MRGIVIGVWSFVVLLLAPLLMYVPAQAQASATVTVTVSVRPPKISLNIHTRDELLLPAKFETVKHVPQSTFGTKALPISSALATISGAVG